MHKNKLILQQANVYMIILIKLLTMWLAQVKKYCILLKWTRICHQEIMKKDRLNEIHILLKVFTRLVIMSQWYIIMGWLANWPQT